MVKNISVIIPIYNRQNLIAETLVSVERQILKPFEVIVVDDQSSDNSASVVNHYATTSKLKIKLIKNKGRKGMCGALNTGIEYAQGEYIACQDSDDLWTPTHLQQLLFAIDKDSQASVAFSKIEIFGDANDVMQKMNDFKIAVSRCLEVAFEKKDEKIWLSNKNLLYALLQWGFPFRCQASLIKRDFFFKYNMFFDEKITYTLDSQFMIMAAYYTPFIFFDEIGLKLRRHHENDGDKNYGEKIVNSYRVRVEKMREFFKDKNLNKLERGALRNALYSLEEYILNATCQNKSQKLKKEVRLLFSYFFISDAVKNLAKIYLNR
jgi:glycosyltransferase involved in cell wall biosynthesis